MKTTATVVTSLFLFAALHGQTIKKVVFYSGEKDCGYSSQNRTEKSSVFCREISTGRGPVSEIEADGVALSVAYLEQGEYILVAARITNSTADPVLFDTDLWGAAHFRTKADFLRGEKPIVAETSIPTRDIIRERASGAKLDGSLDIFIAENQKSSETKEVRQSDGSRLPTVVIVPDKAAQKDALRMSEIKSESVVSEMTKIRKTALTDKTVPAKSFVQGLVYFRRIKKAELVVISIILGESRFVFRYPRKLK